MDKLSLEYNVKKEAEVGWEYVCLSQCKHAAIHRGSFIIYKQLQKKCSRIRPKWKPTLPSTANPVSCPSAKGQAKAFANNVRFVFASQFEYLIISDVIQARISIKYRFMIISTAQTHHNSPCWPLPPPRLSPTSLRSFFVLLPLQYLVAGTPIILKQAVRWATLLRHRPSRPHAEISLKAKLILFQRVLREEASTRETARALGIKYSTAKTLIRNYSHSFDNEDPELVRTAYQEFVSQGTPSRRCGYTAISGTVGRVEGSERGEAGQANKIEIISSIFLPREK